MIPFSRSEASHGPRSLHCLGGFWEGRKAGRPWGRGPLSPHKCEIRGLDATRCPYTPLLALTGCHTDSSKEEGQTAVPRGLLHQGPQDLGLATHTWPGRPRGWACGPSSLPSPRGSLAPPSTAPDSPALLPLFPRRESGLRQVITMRLAFGRQGRSQMLRLHHTGWLRAAESDGHRQV